MSGIARRWFLLLVVFLAACVRGRATPVPQETPSSLPSPTPTRETLPSPTPGTPEATRTPLAPAALTQTAAVPTPTPTETPIPTPAILATPRMGGRRIDRTWNILFLGSDRTSTDQRHWRTDAIMLIMIDKDTGEVAIVSIPRDLYLKIPGYMEERINVADNVGERGKSTKAKSGPDLMRLIFREYFGVRVDNYIRLDIPGLLRIFEILEPVEVDIACEQTLYYLGKTYYFQPGRQSLNAEELFIYMTKRGGKDDMDRIRRQQRGLLALRRRAKELNLLPKLPALYRALSESVQTDLGLLDLLWLGRFAMDLPLDRVYGFALNYKYLQPYTTESGEKVLIPRNWEAIRQAIETVFDQTEPVFKVTECK